MIYSQNNLKKNFVRFFLMHFYLYEYIIGIFYFLKFKSHWTKKTEGKEKKRKQNKTSIIF